ncbi:MAG: phosphoethanolamine transferase [Alphaproteobacteria bacterium HGW-Alphaproteobacteria-11]|nr:MAG: phosphoethanolamine transferase [Alphaproteobacteria bacterium HGW-Alphaproteobacteria-11]
MSILHSLRRAVAWLPRPAPLHPVWLALAASAVLVLFYNAQLWTTILDVWPGRSFRDFAFFGSIGLVLVVAFNLVLQAFAVPRLLKPLLALLFVTAAAVSYFASSYGAVIDKTMIANVMETDMREVGDLLSLRLVAQLVLFGVVPALLIWRVPLARYSWWREVLVRGGTILGSILVVGVVAAFLFQDYASLLRNHRELRFMVNPSAAIYATVRYATAMPSALAASFTQVAKRVSRGPALDARDERKTLVVFVVGETARADHFALNGYERQTNPELSKLDIVSFGEVRSCGTSTAESVPCMFSDLGRAGYSEAKATMRENLLDILVRAGVDVLWLENNSSCKGVCARVPSETTWSLGDTEFCEGGDCRDDLLVRQLGTALAAADNDMIVVMHQIGSHGPSYFKRFTDAYRVFAPTCDTNQLQSCTREEIVNSYDNSLLYTDKILAETVGLLRGASDRFDTAMIYVSDHGESLGENGIYLHGMPYMFAPDVQKHVPMVVWASPGYRARMALDMSCVAADSDAPLSHDNLFHSVLGMFDVRSDVYRRELDIIAPCRKFAPVARAAADDDGVALQ